MSGVPVAACGALSQTSMCWVLRVVMNVPEGQGVKQPAQLAGILQRIDGGLAVRWAVA